MKRIDRVLIDAPSGRWCAGIGRAGVFQINDLRRRCPGGTLDCVLTLGPETVQQAVGAPAQHCIERIEPERIGEVDAIAEAIEGEATP